MSFRCTQYPVLSTQYPNGTGLLRVRAGREVLHHEMSQYWRPQVAS